MTAAPSLVVCSLEGWGDVRRRIRILVDELVGLEQTLRVLYVAPAIDVPYELRRGTLHPERGPKLEQVHPRIHVLRPRKWAPRLLGRYADRSLGRQVERTVTRLGLVDPLLWLNDAAYARFSMKAGWPTIYDVTDDWLLATLVPRQLKRLVTNDHLLVARSDAVVVCSPELARTRGRSRAVELIPNGVDVELFRTPQPRPADLPPGTVALYVGSLHQDRVDIQLLVDLAAARPALQIVLVGPDSLPAGLTAQLESLGSVHLLGARPYDQIPGYFQHADVVVIPHLVNPFTESLDPIKAYECVAAGRPTVATPVAGFRELGSPVTVAERADFVATTLATLDAAGASGAVTVAAAPVATWSDRAGSMNALMHRVRDAGASR